MLLDPLTPPQDHSISPGNSTYNGNGFTSPVGPNAHNFTGLANTFAPTPVSDMGLDNRDERGELAEQADSYDSMDEDQDMSDGGADLTMTLSHAEALNAELDLLDAEVMGPDNFTGLHLATHFPSLENYHTLDVLLNLPPSEPHSPHPQDEQENIMTNNPMDTPDLPATMSQVSQHLQHIQDGQEHVELDMPTDEHGAFTNNSTHPFLVPYIPQFQAIHQAMHGSAGPSQVADYVSLPDISPVQSTEVITELSALESGVGLASAAAATNDSVQPQSPLNASHLSFVDMTWEEESDADQHEVEDQSNLSLGDFLYNWGVSASRNDESRKRNRGPILPVLHRQRFVEDLEPMRRCDLQGDLCDIQRINWSELGVSRLEARQMRRQTYSNYTNVRLAYQWHPRLNGSRLSDHENYFKFRRMDFDHKVHLTHFQLRNLMSCVSRDTIFYTSKSKILQWNPSSGTKAPESVVMNLESPNVQPFHAAAFQGGTQISTLAAGHDILIAGGFCGEYALVNLRSHKDTKHTEGLLTDEMNSITNHVQIHLSRSSSLPVAAFSSNDMGFRILDVNTNQFIAEHKYDHAINCSAISPDQRLRVLVGDTRQVMICNSETGEVLQSLDGHRDYGFACDWADDGWTVATGNQDMQIKIWDARKWTSSSGAAQAVATISAEMGGARKLQFSPVGSGKRVLVAAEPADFVSVIDAQTFTSKQTLSFFGEIGGVDFTNDGQDLIVANCDSMRGGIMQYERCDFAGDGLHGLEALREKSDRYRRKSTGFDWMSDDEDLVNHPKSRGTVTHRRRKAAELGVTIDHF
ncbi:putative WD repeat-containing protein [Lachnellula cervina]|uniref:Putative WD repeat-containing protein n=1 Tax=Lachnellula cervina TaxID=1316786 RepID=A0A7D8Z4B6_9HELO|nr:putative WD repeat-containing protein [Lachnellula cervina]